MVVIWLRVADADSEVAFKIMSSTAKWGEYKNPADHCDPVKNTEQKNELEAMLSFLDREYWTRVWIIQEFVLAGKFILMCGDDKCSGFRFSWFMDFVKNWTCMPKAIEQTQIHEAMANAINKSVSARLCQLRNVSDYDVHRYNQNPGFPKRNFSESRCPTASQTLFPMFTEYEISKCQDRRDKVLGLHSLAKICCQDANPIDYSLSRGEVFANLVRHQTTFHACLPKDIGLNPATALLRIQEFFKAKQFFSDSHQKKAGVPLDALESFAGSFTPCREAPSRITGLRSLSDLVELRPYARGRVCYTSPLLDDLDLSKDCPVIPELTSMVHLQIEYICSLNETRKLCHPCDTTETDLVAVLENGMVHFHGHPKIRETIKSLAQDCIPYWGCNTYKQSGEAAISRRRDNFHQLLRNAQNCFAGTDLILAFEENGLVFLASKSTKVGDLLCQFHGSDVLSIIPAAVGQRGEFDSDETCYMEKVQRAVDFLPSPRGIAIDVCGKRMSFKDAEPYAIELHADLEGIAWLCKRTKFPI